MGAIRDAGHRWLTGLGDIYDWFVESLRGSRYERYATGFRDRRQQRVTDQRWPQFTAI